SSPITGAAAPIPPGPGPAGPAPAGPVPSSPPGTTGGGAAPGHGSSTGGTSGPAHAPGTSTPLHRPAAGIQPNYTGGPGAAPGTPPGYAPGATAPSSGTPAATGNEKSPGGAGSTVPDAPPVVRAPTTSGATAAPGQAAVPQSPDPSVRAPAGHTEPADPPLPGQREALGPAGTGPNSSTTEGHDHAGQRPGRLVPTGMPLPSSAGVPATRPPDSERTSPDYLHAANEELTATEPRVPPVLGEHTETERAERGVPGGGSTAWNGGSRRTSSATSGRPRPDSTDGPIPLISHRGPPPPPKARGRRWSWNTGFRPTATPTSPELCGSSPGPMSRGCPYS